MILKATSLGKRFIKEWIFKDLTYTFNMDNSYAITGANGSGKSTLLQVLANIIPPSQGNIEYMAEDKTISSEEYYRHISFLSPHQELIEELTLKEFLTFHLKFRKLEDNLSIENFADLLSLRSSLNKPIQYFSSGMKQRVKLGLVLYTVSKVLLLDEPTVNLDVKGIDWFKAEIKKQVGKKIIIVCSNQPYEYDFCKSTLSVNDFKV